MQARIADGSDPVAIVDTGLDIAPCREAWDALLAGPLAGAAVTRIIVTHFHPDHVGLAGWLIDRFGGRPEAVDEPPGMALRAHAHFRRA